MALPGPDPPPPGDSRRTSNIKESLTQKVRPESQQTLASFQASSSDTEKRDLRQKVYWSRFVQGRTGPDQASGVDALQPQVTEWQKKLDIKGNEAQGILAYKAVGRLAARLAHLVL